MAQCKATAQATGERCKVHSLKNEEFCLFHSESEEARRIRKGSRPKQNSTREELLRTLTADLRNTKNLEDISESEKIRIRSRLASQISNLLDSLDEIGELRRLAAKKKNET